MFKYSEIDYVPSSFYEDILVPEIGENTCPVVVPKSTTYETELDGQTYSVTMNIGGQIKRIFGKKKGFNGTMEESLYQKPFLVENGTFFSYHDPFEALAKESAYEHDKSNGVEVLDDRRQTKACYKPQSLTYKQAKHRMCVFFKLCKLCGSEEILSAIISKAAKNKNGSFNMRNVLSIASLMCSHEGPHYIGQEFYTLYAQAKSPYQLSIGLKKRTATPDSYTYRFDSRDLNSSGFTMSTGGIFKITDDLATGEENIFQIPIDRNKFSVRKEYEKKISITCNGITVHTPAVTLEDGKIAFALPEPIPFDRYSEILIKSESGYYFETKDHSTTSQIQIGKHTMTVDFQGDYEIKLSQNAMRVLDGIEQYCDLADQLIKSDISIEEIISGLPEWFQNSFYKNRELIRDESVVALGMVYLLDGILDIREQVKTHPVVSIAQQAPLKKNGTFNRTQYPRIQYREDHAGVNCIFDCSAPEDCRYLIKLLSLPFFDKVADFIEASSI